MDLTSLAEASNTREKLRKLEQLHEERSRASSDNPYARELSIRSLAKLIQQLRGELDRFEERASRPDAPVEAPTSEAQVRSTGAG